MLNRTKNMNTRLVKLDPWVKEIIIDPLSKEPLTLDEGHSCLWSPYGRKYPVIDELFDLRVLSNKTTRDQKTWKEGQRQYEKISHHISAYDHAQNYFAEIEGVREVYEDIPVEGSCLDVGGHQGRLRQFLSPGQNYVSCDPFLNVFNNLDKSFNLLKAYPFLLDPVNFVCCDAEFLPFRSSSFQTVHMRSVIDHFLNPELALNEAYRVLKTDGALIVGLFVYGGKRGKPAIMPRIKKFARDIFMALGIEKFKDYHVWHPTYGQLTDLISECGFRIKKVHWQKGHNNTVCYILARKQLGLIKYPTD